jgi:hypothetical protein
LKIHFTIILREICLYCFKGARRGRINLMIGHTNEGNGIGIRENKGTEVKVQNDE